MLNPLPPAGGGWRASMQILRLESLSLDQSLQTGGPPTGWIRPADVFCLAHMGFLKNWLTCQHSLMGIYYTKIRRSGFFWKTDYLATLSLHSFYNSNRLERSHQPSGYSLSTVSTAPYCPFGAFLTGLPKPHTSNYGEKDRIWVGGDCSVRDP